MPISARCAGLPAVSTRPWPPESARVALNPNYAGALSNLGIALFDQGKFDEALGFYDRAVAQDANFAQAHSNRGNARQRLKRFADAEQDYRRALELQPSFADAWNNLGTCLRELKRPEEAETAYRKALDFTPNNPDTLDNLALALKDLERFDEAADLMRRALTIESRDEKLFVHYATVLLDQDKVDEAAAANERALALNADNHDAVNLAGRIAFERGDLAAALAHYRRALTLKPDLADAYNNMGNVLKELGQLHEARDAYVQAVRLDPNIAGVYVNLADSKKFEPDDPHLTLMESLVGKSEGLSKTDRLQLDFALGKAYGDLKDYRRSFAHLLAGNAAKRAAVSYDEAMTFALFDRIEAVFTRELIAAKSGGGDPSRVPIFVIGMPRSGTTLIEQIIASHPMVHGAGELMTFNDVILGVHGPDGLTIPYPDFVPSLDASGLRQIGAGYVAKARALAPRRRARDRQDAVKLLLRGAHPSRAAERQDHPFRARSRRHLHLLLLEAVQRRAEPHLRSRRARPLLPTLRPAHGALAPRAAGASTFSMCATKTWWATSKGRRGGSSPIAACRGTNAVCRFTRPNGRCERRARRRSASRSTPAQSAVGGATRRTSRRCSLLWKGRRRPRRPRERPRERPSENDVGAGFRAPCVARAELPR